MQLPVDLHKLGQRDVFLQRGAQLALTAHPLDPLIGVSLAIERACRAGAAAAAGALARFPSAVWQLSDAHAIPRRRSISARAVRLPRSTRPDGAGIGASTGSSRSLGEMGSL